MDLLNHKLESATVESKLVNFVFWTKKNPRRLIYCCGVIEASHFAKSNNLNKTIDTYYLNKTYIILMSKVTVPA